MLPAILALIILGICVLLFILNCIPSSVTACLACLAMVLFGVCPLETAFSGFSHSVTLLMFGALVFGIAMIETGAANIIGSFVLRLAGNRPRMFLLVGGLVAGCMSMFLANTAVITLFFTIISGLCTKSENMRYKELVMPISFAAVYGGACTLVGSTPQLTANGLIKELTGYEMGMFDFFAPGFCVLLVFVIYTATVGFNMGRKIWKGRSGEPIKENDSNLPEIPNTDRKECDNRKIIIMFCIMGFTMFFYITGWISTTLTAMTSGMLCILFKCIDVPTIIKKMSWESIIFLAACLGLGACITASGAGDLISKYVNMLLGGTVSPFPAFCFFVAASMLLSQVLTNSAVIIIFLPVAVSLCNVYGFNTLPFCIGITLAAGLAVSTPLSAPQIALTLVAGYEFSDYIRYTWLLAILTTVSIIVFVPIFYPLV